MNIETRRGICSGMVAVETISKDQQENDVYKKRLPVEKQCSFVNEVMHRMLSPLYPLSAVHTPSASRMILLSSLSLSILLARLEDQVELKASEA